MKKSIAILTAAAVFAGSIVPMAAMSTASAQPLRVIPAEAQTSNVDEVRHRRAHRRHIKRHRHAHRRHYKRHRAYRHRGYHRHRYGYRRPDPGAAVALGIIGLTTGIIASQAYR